MGMIHSALATSSADVLLYLDRDDPELERYEHELIGHSVRVKPVIGEPIGRGAAINRLCELFQARAYLLVSDDVTFVRDGWDREALKALDEFGDDIGCVHFASENGMPHVNWPMVSKRWINALGWFNPPALRRVCQDTAIQVLAQALDRITEIKPQVVQHAALRRPDYEPGGDVMAFLNYMALNFGEDLRKLRAVCR